MQNIPFVIVYGRLLLSRYIFTRFITINFGCFRFIVFFEIEFIADFFNVIEFV